MSSTAIPEPSKSLALEVLVDTREPVIYMLNKPEIYVGSLDANDIVVNQKEISRKHVKLFFVDQKCYVSDQGSTNGTYVSDTKLVPGKRVEFAPFMSIRLGSKVLLTLISQDRPDVAPDMTERENFIEQSRIKRGQDDKTRIISLKELHSAKTEKIVKRRKEVAAKKLKESKRIREEKAALRHVGKIALMWIVVGIMLNMIWLSLPDKARRIFGVREKRIIHTHVIDDPEDNGFRIPNSKLLSKATLTTFLGAKKCSDKKEIGYCTTIPLLSSSKNGVIKTKSSAALMFLDEKDLITDIQKLASEVLPEDKDLTIQEIQKLSAIKFIAEELYPIIGTDSVETLYYIILYARSEERSRIQSVLAIRKSSMDLFMKGYSEKDFIEHLKTTETFFRNVGEYYQFY